jgi:choline monooxygenase
MAQAPSNPESSALTWRMPREAYISQEWFDREQEELFGRVWTFAATSNELPNPGDYVCVQAGRHPLFVIRGKDGTLRAFHNLCRHRGTAFLEGRGNAKQGLRCPYHYWMYGLDGSLQGVTSTKANYPDLDRSKFGLHPAGIGTFKNLIFVHPEAEPEERFRDFLADLPEKAWPYDGEDLVQGVRLRHVFRANWKLVVENAMDWYHLGYLHQRSLGDRSPTHLAMRTFGRHHFQAVTEAGREAARAEASERPASSSGVPSATEPSEQTLPLIQNAHPSQFLGYIYFFFPNFAVGAFPMSFAPTRIVPIAPDRTHFDTLYLVSPACTEGDIERLKQLEGVPDLPWDEPSNGEPVTQTITLEELHTPALRSSEVLQGASVTIEDQWIAERIQLAMHSPRFEVGPMAPHGESPIPFFQKSILDYVSPEPR